MYKVTRIEVIPNDDNTYQVECRAEDESEKGELCCCSSECKKYSAKDLPEVMTKIKEAMADFEGMESKSKGKVKKDDSVEKFMGVEKDED